MSKTTLPTPKVIIDRMALEKIRYFVDKDSNEVSGMGLTRVVGDTIYVDDVQLLEQRNSAAHTDIDAEAVTKLMAQWAGREGNVNFWWHSHVNMSVFWSATDEATIKQLGQHGMCVASVFNKKGEIRTAVCCKTELPFVSGPQVVMFDEIPLQVKTEVPVAIKELWDREHAANVKQHVTSWQGTNHMGFQSGAGGWRVNRFIAVQNMNKFGFWNSPAQMRVYDTDVDGSKWDIAEQAWAWSPDYLGKYKDYLERLEKQMPQGEPDEDRIKYAESRDEIVGYDRILDMFELYTGQKVDAEWYMSLQPNAVVCRNTTAREFVEDKRAAEDKLDQDIAAFERDMKSGEAGLDLNHLTDEELEDLWRRRNSLAQ